MPSLLTPPEAAQKLALTVRQLLKLARAGVVPSVRITRRTIRFSEVALEKWAEGKETR